MAGLPGSSVRRLDEEAVARLRTRTATNAVSEAMKTTAAPEMIDWLNEHETPHPFSTAVTIGEDEAASDPS